MAIDASKAGLAVMSHAVIEKIQPVKAKVVGGVLVPARLHIAISVPLREHEKLLGILHRLFAADGEMQSVTMDFSNLPEQLGLSFGQAERTIHEALLDEARARTLDEQQGR